MRMKPPGWAATGLGALTVLVAACSPGEKAGDPVGGKTPASASAPAAASTPTMPPPAPSSAPPSAPQVALPAASSPDGSAACFNVGWIAKPGSVFDYDLQMQDASGTRVQRMRIEVIGPATYQGRPAIETRVKFQLDTGASIAKESRTYLMVDKDGFADHVEERVDDKAPPADVLEPLRRTKIDMRPGETLQQEQVIRDGVKGSNKVLGKASWTWTYKGREKIESAWGPLDSCRFDSVDERRKAGLTHRIETTQWVVASGLYRGFSIKSIVRGRYTPPGIEMSGTLETIKFHEFTLR